MATYQTLPIDSSLSQIFKAVAENPNVIIVAEPGAGKTTRIPVALSKDGHKWIVLQPRRWAARLSATRIAEEQKFTLGEEVGYQIRFDSKQSKNTRILFMTEGVLLRKLAVDPELKGYQGVILDEFHERSLDLDLAISILKEIQQSLRPDLKLVVMSATLDPKPLEDFLEQTQTFSIPGRTFPVERKYLGEVSIISALKTALQEMDQHYTEGDILVFLPGSYEINRAVNDLQRFLADQGRMDFEALPLYASLPESEQKKIFQTPKAGAKRKIICSTNIAETSLTLPNVKVVIDSGWAKVMRTDPQLGQDRLETIRISRASSEQRAGRAGRVSAGICYRLWTEAEQLQLRHFETPEVHRVHLGQALLFLSDFGVGDFLKFGWFEKPKSSMLEFSIRELEKLGFLNGNRITAEGREALQLPIAPRLAKLILVSRKENQLAFGARLGAFLEDRSSGANELAVQSSEALIRSLNQLRGAGAQNAKQLARGEPSLVQIENWPEYERILIQSLASRIFIDGRLVGRRKVSARDRILPKAGLVLQSMEKTERGVPLIQVQSWVEILPESLLRFATKKRNTWLDEEAGRIRSVEGLFFEDLELGALTDVKVNAEEAHAILVQVMMKNPLEYLSKNEDFARWHARVRFFNRSYKASEKDTEEKLELNWNEIVPMLCEGKTRLSEVSEGPLLGLIEGLLDLRRLKVFREWAPEKIEVPTGNFLRIDYESSDQPKLSVRLQEIFGWLDTPRIAGERVPLLIELLSPGFKPLQLTQDLRSFWSNAYFEVKKELKARYPKHSWPDDPLTAKPEAKGRRRQP